MKRVAVLALLISAACAHQPVDEPTLSMIGQLEAALAKQPSNTPYIYILATTQDRAKNAGEVVRWLRRLDELQWEHGVPAYDFPNTQTRAFHEIAARLNAREPRINRAAVAFVVNGHKLQKPEGIAYDPNSDAFFLSSLADGNVLRVMRSGKSTPFAPRTGMPGLGMKVDATRRLLWVIRTAEDNSRSTLTAYDLGDARVVQELDVTPAALNDLTLLADGTLYATDMARGKVVRLAPGANALEIFAEDFGYPNGITNDGRNLYVADFRGITRFDLTTKERTKIESKTLLNGIDGLDFANGSLIGIQNSIGNPRVIRIALDGNVEVLETKNANFSIPTTGFVVGNEYCFIANSELRSKTPRDPVMLRLAL